MVKRFEPEDEAPEVGANPCILCGVLYQNTPRPYVCDDCLVAHRAKRERILELAVKLLPHVLATEGRETPDPVLFWTAIQKAETFLDQHERLTDFAIYDEMKRAAAMRKNTKSCSDFP